MSFSDPYDVRVFDENSGGRAHVLPLAGTYLANPDQRRLLDTEMSRSHVALFIDGALFACCPRAHPVSDPDFWWGLLDRRGWAWAKPFAVAWVPPGGACQELVCGSVR